jgi:hypothetical protein
MHLTDEAGRASAHPADPARIRPCLTAIADLAETDTKVVFITRHEMTIGSPMLSRKIRNAVRMMQRRNTCPSEDTAVSDSPHVACDGSRNIERE